MNRELNDTYISYAAEDEPWVEAELMPRLKSKAIRYTDAYQFRGGVPQVNEVRRLINESSRTVLVLSPSYLKNNWVQYGVMLVLTRGIDTGRWLAVPLVASACADEDLPAEIKALVRIDVSNGDTQAWDQFFATLAEAPAPLAPADFADITQMSRPQPGRGQPVISTGLKALAELMQRDDVRDAVAEYRAEFHAARDQIQILADFKDMHDELHLMQKESHQPLRNAMGKFPEDANSQLDVKAAEFDLKRSIENIKEILKHPAFTNPWVYNLEDALVELHSANTEKSRDALDLAVENIERVLGDLPSKINDRLIEAARPDRLKFAELVIALASIRLRLEVSSADQSRTARLAAAIDNLADLYHRLNALVIDHDIWQQVDNELRRIRRNFSIKELKLSWKFLQEGAAPAYIGRTEPWARDCGAAVEQLGAAIAKTNEAEAREPFQQLYGYAGDRFIRVDRALKRLCGNMREVGELLDAILEIIG